MVLIRFKSKFSGACHEMKPSNRWKNKGEEREGDREKCQNGLTKLHRGEKKLISTV